MDAVQIANIAGGFANTVVALANISLVLFIWKQISMQREFFRSQSKRDARIKISDSWQKVASEMTTSFSVAHRFWAAERFWPTADENQIKLIAAYMYTLNTLQLEYRFVEEGLHAYSNFLGTLKYILGTIKEPAELSCIEELAKSVGFDEKFVEIVDAAVSARRNEL